MKYQMSGKLYGHDPLKGIAYILSVLALCLVMAAPAFAAWNDKATLGGVYSGDTYDCAVNSSGNFVCQGSITSASSSVTGAVQGASVTATGAVQGLTVVGTASVTSPIVNGTTITATGAVQGANVVGTTSITAPMFKINGTTSALRPASGATAGSVIAITNSNGASNCGTTADGGSAGTTFVVCVSNGTDWVVL